MESTNSCDGTEQLTVQGQMATTLTAELAVGKLKPLDVAIPDLADNPRIADGVVGQGAERARIGPK